MGRQSGPPTPSRCCSRSPSGCRSSASTPTCCTSSTRPAGPVRAWRRAHPFALAHTFGQTGPFRPANTVRGVDNVVLAGSSTVPGVGVPTALLSGRLAADRITRCRRTTAPSTSGEIMISSELHAAGVRDPELRDAYRRCRTLNSQHGRTFFLATRLLAPQQRPAVHALYGFARRADDILDDFDPARDDRRARRTAAAPGHSAVQPAGGGRRPTTTIRLWPPWSTPRASTAIPWELFDDFLGSMRMDLTTTDYPDRAALDRYMYGSAEVIGLQMLPVLGTVSGREEAAPYAAALGKAFQLTNFLRDVDEDLQRGRIYLPADELAEHRSRPRRADVVPHQSTHRPAGAAGAGRPARRDPAHLRFRPTRHRAAASAIAGRA